MRQQLLILVRLNCAMVLTTIAVALQMKDVLQPLQVKNPRIQFLRHLACIHIAVVFTEH